MTPHLYTRLKQHILLKIEGDDVEFFLQNLFTLNLQNLDEKIIYPSALLSPQGKILFNFLIFRHNEIFFIDIHETLKDLFLQKLSLYRLHAKVTFSIEGSYQIFVGQFLNMTPTKNSFLLNDNRLNPQQAIKRYYHFCSENIPCFFSPTWQHSLNFWDKIAFNHGFLECGKDYDQNTLYPYDLNYDKIGALSFNKGCYIGQEVMSRLYHRNSIKKRLFIAQSTNPIQKLTKNADIKSETKNLGSILVTKETKSLCLLKIDPLNEALLSSQNITADGISIALKDCQNMSFLNEKRC